VLVRLDHIAGFIVNANHGMMRWLKIVAQLAADMQPVCTYAREGQLGESVITIETLQRGYAFHVASCNRATPYALNDAARL
jgi:hypothetical protein